MSMSLKMETVCSSQEIPSDLNTIENYFHFNRQRRTSMKMKIDFSSSEITSELNNFVKDLYFESYISLNLKIIESSSGVTNELNIFAKVIILTDTS